MFLGFLHAALIVLITIVICVPLFKRLGLGSVLGYLCAGVLLGPSGFGFFENTHDLLEFSEIGIVMLLFIIGLEMDAKKLWENRADIFGLGFLQVMLCGILMMLVTKAFGLGERAAIVVGFGLALSSTAFALQLLQEKGHLTTPYGQKSFHMLLFQDLSVVPLLALVSILSTSDDGQSNLTTFEGLSVVFLSIGFVIFAGKYLVTSILRFASSYGGYEVMTAISLLIVLGAAALMHSVGLSMAMGAFLAGMMLAESSYRNQLQVDIDPFRGLFLGLFFLSVGMIIDLDAVAMNFLSVIGLVLIMMVTKGVSIYFLARFFHCTVSNAIRIALTLCQGGEFAFLMLTQATENGLIAEDMRTLLVAVIALSMAVTPLIRLAYDALLPRFAPDHSVNILEKSFEGVRAKALVVGMGRFGRIVSAMLNEENISITAIDNNPEKVTFARKEGLSVYYGDATRLDVFRAVGASEAHVIAICFPNRLTCRRVIKILQAEFPHVKLFCRAIDRAHERELAELGVAFHISETLESSILFGKTMLADLGVTHDHIPIIEEVIREKEQIKKGSGQA